MHKERLKLALSKMNDAHGECECLELRGRGRSTVDQRTAVVDERMDDEGSEVLDDEDGSP